MNVVLQNLTRQPEAVKRFYRVVKPLSGNRFQVKDSSGRVAVVESGKKWSVGAGVTVSQGWIVGAATKFINPKVYEV